MWNFEALIAIANIQAAVTVAAKTEEVSSARGFILKERLVLRVCTIFFMLLNSKRKKGKNNFRFVLKFWNSGSFYVSVFYSFANLLPFHFPTLFHLLVHVGNDFTKITASVFNLHASLIRSESKSASNEILSVLRPRKLALRAMR